MKKFLFFCLLFFYIIFFAQLDRDHWFAPMVDRSAQNTYPAYQSLYLSTNELGPVKVDIYSNNVIIGTKTISKGNPQKFPVPRNFIITTGNANLFKPVAMGLYVKGDKPFFASLRFSVNQHAEIVTSKGTAGIGTEFYATPAPIASSLNNVNFITSILATENNTQVTINNFNPTVQFSDNIVRNNFSFTLQQGEAFIIDGSSTFGQNWEGFIGAKITATAPISVTNGNFNGQYVPTSASSTDILMDQSVPIEKLGKEFVLVKGNGTIYQPTSSNYSQNMEKAYIVTAVNGTNIYVNDGTTPINPVPLNAGQPFVIGSEHYINQGNQQYNMFVRSTENIYVFQLLAGASVGNEIATGGYNYIPPLSCYLPKKIDEIGFVNENEGYKGGFYESTSPTKLNIITEAGAVVTVQKNGANFPLISIDGPYPVLGSTNWVTYSIERLGTSDVSGNITIVSDKAVTAGISAGDDAVGYGGYFAGFSSTPIVTKVEGDCLPDAVKLAVIEGFDKYQWLQKVGSTYINAPATALSPTTDKFFYYPSQAGIYAVKIKQGACSEIQTEDFKFFNCTSYTNINYATCTVQQIIPKFALSTQSINPATVQITEAPTKGVVTIAANGTLTYTANPNATGIDTFKFSFCGIGAIPDCEVIQATIQINQIVKYDITLPQCSNTNTAIYNLNDAAVTPDLTVQKRYYKNLALTIPIPAAQWTNYPGTAGEIVYVYMKNSFGCDDVATITLKIDAPITINENLYTKLHCDEDLDGIIDGKYRVNVNTITPIVVPNIPGITTRYYDTEAKANIGGTDNIVGVFVFNNDATPIWIWVKTNDSCPPIIKKIILRTGTKFNINNPVTTFACDNDLNNSAEVNLSDYVTLFSTDTNVNVKYFDTLLKAQNNITGEDISSNQTITTNKIFYYRFKKTGICDAIGILNLDLRQPRTSTILVNKEICEESTTNLNAGSGFDGYLWSNGETTEEIIGVPIGDYWVDLTSNGCVYRQNVSVTAVEIPKIISVEINGSTVTVNATGGNPPLQYALDNFNYQSSNIFTNVTGGQHTVFVISADNCIPISAEIEVIQLFNVITPNADGINDVLNYAALLKKEEPFIQIYDRFGQLVFKGDPNNKYSWDGKSNSKPVATGNYWYVMKWKEPGFSTVTEYSGWILVKNRE